MKKALVIGAAISGAAAARLLAKQGYEVFLTDQQAIPEAAELRAAGIRVYPGGHPDALKRLDYDLVVKNPGIKYETPFVDYFVKQGMKIYNEIEIALRYAPNYRVAAVTGTNGKTTTTTLLGLMLKAADPANIAAGNIGTALSSAVLEDPLARRDVALEIAAFQLLGTERFKPKAAVIINLTPDHLDYFGTLDRYYRAKCLVYRNQDATDYFLRNTDNPLVMQYCQKVPSRVIDFSIARTDVPLRIEDGKAWLEDTALFAVDQLHIPGPHNRQNALIAAGLAYLMGVSPELIAKTIDGFQGVEHRIEFTGEIGGVRYYNDSKGTNVDATIVALKAFDCPIHLLAGGYDKHLSFESLRPYLAKVKQMYVFGTTKNQLKEICPQALVYDNMAAAVRAAAEQAKPGEVVLLSPACASWDQFPNYEVRGQQFKQLVREIAAAERH